MNDFLKTMIAVARKRGLWQKLAPHERKNFVLYLYEQYGRPPAGDSKGALMPTDDSGNDNLTG